MAEKNKQQEPKKSHKKSKFFILKFYQMSGGKNKHIRSKSGSFIFLLKKFYVFTWLHWVLVSEHLIFIAAHRFP